MTSTPAGLEERPSSLSIPSLELPAWAERFGLVAGITTRDGAFNLGLLTERPAAEVLGHWRVLAAAVRSAFPTIVVGLQVHGREVAIPAGDTGGLRILDGVDGHATTHAGVLLCVTVADCVPVYLVHPPTGTLALLHAGWRGVAAGVLEAGLATMHRLSGAAVDETVMHCGVGICGTCYHVGSDVLRAVTGRASDTDGPLDLRAVLGERARAAGIVEVTTSPWCSAHHADRFFSHRRSGGADGRMVAYLGRPLA